MLLALLERKPKESTKPKEYALLDDKTISVPVSESDSDGILKSAQKLYPLGAHIPTWLYKEVPTPRGGGELIQ